MAEKNDLYFISKIIEDMNFIIKHSENKSKEIIVNDEVLLDSFMFRLIQISENSTKLTDLFKSSNQEIPWFAIKGLRNRIVHDYGTVDYDKIYETITIDIPSTLKIINKIIK